MAKYTKDIYQQYHTIIPGVWGPKEVLDIPNSFLYSEREIGNTYIQKMKDAAIKEVEETNNCWLLNWMLSEYEETPEASFFAWDVNALAGMVNHYQPGTFPSSNNGALLPFVDIPWEGSSRTRLKLDREVYQILKAFSESLRKPRGIPIDGTPSRNSDSVVKNGRAPGAVRSNADDSSKDIRKREETMKKNEELLKEAEAEKKRIIDEARNQAETVRREAESERDRILSEAHAYAAKIRQDAEISKKSIQESVKTDYLEAMARDAYIAEGSDPDSAAEYTRIREDLRESILQLRDDTKESLQDTVTALEDKLTAFKDNLTSLNRQIRETLYSADFKQLALFYYDLYQYTNRNLDQLKEKLDQEDPAYDALAKQLDSQQATLVRFLKKLERVMSHLGLIFYRPDPGDLCDDVLHQDEYEEDTISGLPILRCVSPGIRVEGENGVILITAGVELDHSSNGRQDENENPSLAGEEQEEDNDEEEEAND